MPSGHMQRSGDTELDRASRRREQGQRHHLWFLVLISEGGGQRSLQQILEARAGDGYPEGVEKV